MCLSVLFCSKVGLKEGNVFLSVLAEEVDTVVEFP